ncbi:Flp pilus assembly protein CpaB [Cognatiyoonia sp. IB215446]|uniref:Flp pilus assembly protein CpaB n=1 Tax=Cognatiyoonia sp. IB215446 TaxID=3097355 RepID=UPI002A0E53ED|nr:Flp pilus assembly protein CpaB [Cognatiyoonia sp. IB215446]MDX8347277.1 Flp pilus assembly protein CpaB [Cognatiyoonia sp. IB215446]
MRAVFGLVLLVGMGLAGFAVYMVNQFLDQQAFALEQERARAANIVATIDVYSPSRDISYGERLTIDDVKVIKYASDYLPEGIFRTEEELFPEGVNVPRVVRIPMRVNEPITLSKVTRAGAPQGITALLDPGMRAFPLPDRITEAFSGELRIADLIDLYWVGNVDVGEDISRLVKTRLEIIAMDEPDENGDGGGNGVVVQVSQEDFAELQALQAAGSLSLTPVGSSDLAAGDVTIQTNIRDILGIVDAPEPVVEEEPEECFRTERRGVDMVQIPVACN